MGGERGLERRSGPSTRHGSAPQKKPRRRKKGLLNPPDEALGISRGGFSTKLNLTCDGRGRPLSIVVAPGQGHESTQLKALLDAIRVPRMGVGRPRKRPSSLIADKGYSFPSCRELLRKRGIPHTIPERRDQRRHRKRRPGRQPGFDKSVYRRRNVVERCVNRLKQWRGIATRYEKRAVNYRAAVVIVALMTWVAS